MPSGGLGMRMGSLPLEQLDYYRDEAVEEVLVAPVAQTLASGQFGESISSVSSKRRSGGIKPSWSRFFGSTTKQVVESDYSFLEVLTESPRGVTSLAVDKRTSMRVAVRKTVEGVKKGNTMFSRKKKKGVKPDDLVEKENRDTKLLFANEVELLQGFNNFPFIVRFLRTLVHDVKPQEYWLVTEWCEGNNVASLLQRRGSLELAEIKAIMSCALLGLIHMHEAGVAHGSLSLAKILLSNSGVAKLSGFSYSVRVNSESLVALDDDQVLSRHVKEEKVDFTYLAPETLHLGKIGYASDVWAFGLLLLHMSSGKTPFGGSNEGSQKERIKKLQIQIAEEAEINAKLSLIGVQSQANKSGLEYFYKLVTERMLKSQARSRPTTASLAKLSFFKAHVRDFRDMASKDFYCGLHDESDKACACQKTTAMVKKLVFDAVV